MPDGWLCRMALTLIRPTGAICLGLGLPDGGYALSGLRVRYACGVVLPDGGYALSGLRVRYAWGFWLCRMAAAPYPAYGCDMLGFGFAGWRLRLIRPTGAICRGFWVCRMAAAPYPAYGCHMPAVLVLVLPDGGCALSGLRSRSC